jgi:hypothetical protein
LKLSGCGIFSKPAGFSYLSGPAGIRQHPPHGRLRSRAAAAREFREGGQPQPISPNISQETLAEMIGTTRSRVGYFMNKFRKLGLIDYNGHIEVHNSLLSAVLHEKPQQLTARHQIDRLDARR